MSKSILLTKCDNVKKCKTYFLKKKRETEEAEEIYQKEKCSFLKRIKYPTEKDIILRRCDLFFNRINPSTLECLMKNYKIDNGTDITQDFIVNYDDKYWISQFKGEFELDDIFLYSLSTNCNIFYCYRVVHRYKSLFVCYYESTSCQTSYYDKDISKNFIKEKFKERAAKKIQKAVRLWLGQIEYSNGHPGFYYRKANEDFSSLVST